MAIHKQIDSFSGEVTFTTCDRCLMVASFDIQEHFCTPTKLILEEQIRHGQMVLAAVENENYLRAKPWRDYIVGLQEQKNKLEQ